MGVVLSWSSPRGLAVVVTAVALTAAGCSTTPPAASSDRIVLAEAQPLGDFNPVLGYGGAGVSPIYDALYRPEAPDDQEVPALVPALAAAPPELLEPRRWRVPLRTDVTFSDGSAFDSADVVATYTAVKNPAVASEISTHVAPVAAIAADGPHAVTVEVETDADPTPYLLVGIAPSETIENRPAADWALNTRPVGTGPYRLESLRPDQAVLVARDDYWGQQPQVKRLVYTHNPDDNIRAQRIVAGEVDGVNLPPRLVDSINAEDVATVAALSADWRAVALPAGNAFTADPQARLALNVGVDRDAMIRDVLAGHGRPAHTPVADVYGDAFNPEATFTFDQERAQQILQDAGWSPGADGIREKDGAKASFELLYNAQDSLRQDLAVAFAAAVRPLGVDVRPRGTSWDDIDTRFGDSAVVLGGGETPYSIDSQVYDTLHTRVPDSSPYSNPGNFTAPGLDELLEQARESASGPGKDALYRDVQARYVAEPSYVFLTFLDHTYAYRELGWNQSKPILEPHSHGVAWGPWWHIAAWTRDGNS
ncbi:ABC transporter substrate-binding protein [Mycolicibacterium pulveris]|uniref:ABC transporter substrate-binding protein n=1 Tax=Mycolicibacterium pulveris TaxID=36813 RepID=UPI003CF863B9